ncbi:MAG TPA: creatininase family protein [Casimicrobiaceae bacterium]|nr:creatininase family protein [Casimicrobiaceae bacterium]
MRSRIGSIVRFAAAAALAGLTALAIAPPARAAASVYLDDLTTTEVEAAVAAGATTVLVPIGGTEENGPHMVLGKHNVRARVLAGRIAHALGNTLVAPVIAYVPEGSIEPPSEHMRFTGTISIPPAAFEATLEAIAESFAAHGFRDIVFLGDHGGYRKSEAAAAARFNRTWKRSPARALALAAYYRAAAVDFPAALRERGYTNAEIGTHAGLADTALALAVDPALVREDILRGGRDLDAAHGVYGDPRRATAALGAPGVDDIVRASVAAIRQALTRH